MAEVWQLREQGVPVPVIAERYGVSPETVYNSLHRHRIKNGLPKSKWQAARGEKGIITRYESAPKGD